MLRPAWFASVLLLPTLLTAQSAPSGSVNALLDKAEATSSLVGGAPFHAEMKIAGAEGEPQYTGSITIDWAAPARYRVEVRSPQFHQVRTDVGEEVQEQNDGDFYPGWLHNFVKALLEPFAVKRLLLAPGAQLDGSRTSSSSGDTETCVKRNDRPGGITDDLTWSGICISGDGALRTSYDFV